MKSILLSLSNRDADIVSSKTINYVSPNEFQRKRYMAAAELVSGFATDVFKLYNHDMEKGDRFTIEAIRSTQTPALFNETYNSQYPSITYSGQLGYYTYYFEQLFYIIPNNKNEFKMSVYPVMTTNADLYQGSAPTGMYSLHLFKGKTNMRIVSEYIFKIPTLDYDTIMAAKPKNIKLAIKSFNYITNYPTSNGSNTISKLIIKGIPFYDIQSSTGEYILLSGNFHTSPMNPKSIDDNLRFRYVNKDPYNNSYDIDATNLSWLANGFRVSIKSSKFKSGDSFGTNQSNNEIIEDEYEGNIFNIELIIFYE